MFPKPLKSFLSPGHNSLLHNSPTQLQPFVEPPITALLQDVSPNVPLLNLNYISSPGVKLASPLLPALTASANQEHRQHDMFKKDASYLPFYSEFGDLADISRLGELPSEDDLKIPLYGPHTHYTEAPVIPTTMHFNQKNIGRYMGWNESTNDDLNLQSGARSAPGGLRHFNYIYNQNNTTGVLPSDHHHVMVPVMMSNALFTLPNHHSHQPQFPIQGNERHLDGTMVRPTPNRKRHADRAVPRSQLNTKYNRTAPKQHFGRSNNANKEDFDDDPGSITGKTYRGVSRHRLTQRWEASLWLNGRQLYLGGFDDQVEAARAYDLAALACKGMDAVINFPVEDYTDDLNDVDGYSREEVVAHVRRRSAAFSRGKSKYRGVSGHNGRWEARIGSFNGKKNVSFGIFETEEGAGRQYDRALILEKGRSAKTNFPLRDYELEVEKYKLYMAKTTSHLPKGSPAMAMAIESYTLPIDREATADERKRSAIIYGEALRQALEES